VHTSRSDSRRHITVKYYDSKGLFLGTCHIAGTELSGVEEAVRLSSGRAQQSGRVMASIGPT
jgi:hypothetical protein